MTACLVGEPTCPETFGEMMKIGRRGSLTAQLSAAGVQGHSAYPHRARNAAHAMVDLLARLRARPLDAGTAHFDASTLAVTTIDVGNPAANVIPAACRATVNIRFNDLHSGASLTAWLRDQARAVAAETGVALEVAVKVSGEAFLTPPGELSALVARAVAAETGIEPRASTTGGTSDARFIRAHCPVVEFGLVGQSMHQADEWVAVEQIGALKRVYGRILRDYFA
jgi:succinyl-diaminopimelate desuccinylase